ncbi:unnamed protein product [Leptidea sinapis]|uniref:Uncharacterized protein n=1 Tax=Leptidea sinapis TaxID=189913 RepID=A0A5E4PQS7_9NEOP|nr:unnamed protein product [Leptidea sinapis]
MAGCWTVITCRFTTSSLFSNTCCDMASSLKRDFSGRRKSFGTFCKWLKKTARGLPEDPTGAPRRHAGGVLRASRADAERGSCHHFGATRRRFGQSTRCDRLLVVFARK